MYQYITDITCASDIAPWFRLRQPTYVPGFQSQAHHLQVFQFRDLKLIFEWEKDESKRKRGWDWPLKKNNHCMCTYYCDIWSLVLMPKCFLLTLALFSFCSSRFLKNQCLVNNRNDIGDQLYKTFFIGLSPAIFLLFFTMQRQI